IAGSYAIHAHMSRHAHALEYPRGKSRRADRTWNLKHRTMRLRTSTEMMAPDYTGESAAFADAHNVYKLLALENIYQHPVAGLYCPIAFGLFLYFDRDLANELYWRQIVFSQMTLHRLSQAGFLHKLHQANLSRIVSVPRLTLLLGNHAGARLQDSGWMYVTLAVGQLRHSNFLVQNSSYLCHAFSLCLICSPKSCLSQRPLFMFLAKRLDFDVHPGGQVKLHQRIYGLGCRIQNVQQALVSSDFELLPRFFVHVRGTQHAILVLHCRQRNRPCETCACPLGGFDDLGRGLIQNAIIVCLQPDPNFFVSYHVSLSNPSRLSGKKELAASCGPQKMIF